MSSERFFCNLCAWLTYDLTPDIMVEGTIFYGNLQALVITKIRTANVYEMPSAGILEWYSVTLVTKQYDSSPYYICNRNSSKCDHSTLTGNITFFAIRVYVRCDSTSAEDSFTTSNEPC